MAYKFQQIEPQPARGKLVESMWDDPNWIAEEKYDGDRRITQFCGKVVRFTGRRVSVKDGLYVEKTENVPHLSGGYATGAFKFNEETRHVPPAALEGTVLDGEMIFTGPGNRGYEVPLGGRSKFVTSIMGSLPEEAVQKQIERGWLCYVVFDCLFLNGSDLRNLTLLERRVHAERVVKAWGNPFASIAERPPKMRKREFLADVLKRGGEGVILKHLDHRYGDKKGWVKVKAEWTADVVIMGFVPAKEMSKKVNGDVSMTKYAKAGLIGAIQCGQYMPTEVGRGLCLREVATVSGMDDVTRELLTRYGHRPGRYIGKVIEIAHNGREPTGRFRHPRFKRFRDDKQAKDCIYREGEI